nr:universal stress protein [Hyphomonas sp. Mor2]
MAVLCVLGGDVDRCVPHLETSISVAKQLATRMDGLLAMPDPANTAMYFVSAEAVMAGASGVSAVSAAQTTLRKDYDAAFKSAVSEAGSWLNADLKHETGHVQTLVANHAILSDATVFPREAAQSGHALNPVFEYALMEERLPAILASSSGKLTGPAVIAWDGSPRAMRAVRAHLPLIQSLGEAIVAHNPDKDRELGGAPEITTPEALSDWLHDERVTARVETFSGKVSDGLLKIAGTHKAGPIVMGAYGHSRIGQMLFGGTSRALMNAEVGPALALAH